PSSRLLACRAQLGGRVLNGLDDLVVARAAAQVAGDAVPDLLVRRIGMPLQEVARAHQHAGRAEAALQAVLLPEALLQRVERAALCQTLDGLDGAAVGLDGEDGAALHGATVEADGAGAAARRVATDVRTGQPEVLADEVDEQRAGADLAAVLLAVD